TYYWKQTFPAKVKIAISHTYTPAVGAFVFYRDILNDTSFGQDYCIDAGTEAAIRTSMKQSTQNYLVSHPLTYILITANNWAETIGDFPLTIDKQKTENLITTCLEGLAKTGPAKFELHRTDYTPDKDLKILFLEAYKPAQQILLTLQMARISM